MKFDRINHGTVAKNQYILSQNSTLYTKVQTLAYAPTTVRAWEKERENEKKKPQFHSTCYRWHMFSPADPFLRARCTCECVCWCWCTMLVGVRGAQLIHSCEKRTKNVTDPPQMKNLINGKWAMCACRVHHTAQQHQELTAEQCSSD